MEFTLIRENESGLHPVLQASRIPLRLSSEGIPSPMIDNREIPMYL